MDSMKCQSSIRDKHGIRAMRVYLSFQFKFSTTFDSNYGKRDKELTVEERYCTLTKLGIYKK